MKRNTIYKFMIMTFVSLMTASCQEEEALRFDPTVEGLNIWVGNANGQVYESTSYNYSYAMEEGSVTFYARVYGLPSDKDRTFRLEAFGEQFEDVAPTIRDVEYIMPAGKIQMEFQVYFNSKKLPSSDLFTEEDGSISFRMVPNEHFAPGAERMQSFTVTLRNRLAKPDNWEEANYPNVALKTHFGAYSQIKYQFMIEVLGLIDFKISYNATTAIDESSNTVSNAYAIYLKQLMQQALSEYNATHKQPMTDENGNLILFE